METRTVKGSIVFWMLMLVLVLSLGVLYRTTREQDYGEPNKPEEYMGLGDSIEIYRELLEDTHFLYNLLYSQIALLTNDTASLEKFNAKSRETTVLLAKLEAKSLNYH